VIRNIELRTEDVEASVPIAMLFRVGERDHVTAIQISIDVAHDLSSLLREDKDGIRNGLMKVDRYGSSKLSHQSKSTS